MPLLRLTLERLRELAACRQDSTAQPRESGLDREPIVDLASLRNPHGCGPKARAVLAHGSAAEGEACDLKAKIAHRFGLAQGQVVLGDGANDVLSRIARAFLTAGDSSLYSQYAFARYALATRECDARAIEVRAQDDEGHDLNAMLAAIEADTRLVWIASPNNPTGMIVRPGDMLEFLEHCPKRVLVVLDEAGIEYVPRERQPDTLGWLRQFPNLIFVRTFSNAYGLDCHPVGYALANPEVAARIGQQTVSPLAQAAACAALDDEEFLRESQRANRAGMKQLTDALAKLGIPYIPGYGNFVTFRCGDAVMLDRFMRERGVRVCPLTDYGLADSVRVAIGLPQHNARFIEVLEEAMNG